MLQKKSSSQWGKTMRWGNTEDIYKEKLNSL